MNNIFKKLSILTLAELGEKAIIFLLFIYMGRVLTPKDFGYLNYILAVVSYFIIFIDLGLPQLATREIASNNNKISLQLLQIISLTKFVLFIIIAIFWNLFVFYTQDGYINIGLFMNLYLLSRVFDIYWFLQGLQKFETIAKLKLIKSLILSSSFIILYLYPKVSNYLIILIISLLIPFVLYVLKHNLTPYIFNKKINFLLVNRKRIKVFIFKSLPLVASTFLILMYYNLDSILIKHYLGLDYVAKYNAAYKIIFAFIVVRSIFTSVIFPRISKDKLKWNEGRIFLSMGVFIALCIFMIGFFFSKELLYIAYGNKYLDSANVFFILSITASILWINLFFPIFFIAIKKDTFYMKVHIMTALLNLVGNIVLIPLYGIEGAAIATLVADLVSLFIFSFFYFKGKAHALH